MKKWLAVMGILGLSVMTLAACGNKGDSKVSGEKQTITVATDSDTAPFTFKKGDDFKGYDIDLVKAVFKDSDKYEVKFVTTPFDSILTGVDSGRYQIAANDFNYNEEDYCFHKSRPQQSGRRSVTAKEYLSCVSTMVAIPLLPGVGECNIPWEPNSFLRSCFDIVFCHSNEKSNKGILKN